MISFDGPNENRVLTVTVSEKITKEDYEQLMPRLQQMLEKHGSLCFYVTLVDFTGYEMEAFWDELKFDREHRSQYGRTAVVGDKKWEEWGTKISRMFFDTEMKFFDKNQSEEAWMWVNSSQKREVA